MSLLEKSAKEPNISPKNIHDISDNNVISQSNSSSNSDSDVTESQNNFQRNINQIPTLTTRMLNLCRDFAIFYLVMVTLSAFTKDPPKISKPPAAYPFFPEGSIITDWYRGHISKAIESTRSNDIAFIMFYAPWDAESQAARKEFEATARYMQDYVSFAAVNCWQPHGECRTQYSKVYKWPVLIAFPAHGRGVQYNGPMNAPHMIRFLQKICNPIVRVSKEKPKDFEDAYVVAELNTSPGSISFAVFYTAALNYLEKDPQHRLTFYINPLPTSEPSLYLHLWNETLIFPHDKHWTPDAILQWIFKSAKQVTAWVMPSGTKSVALSMNMDNNPALILFTPKNPLRSSTDYYNMLQEIGQEYYSCHENVMVNMHSLSIKLKRSANLLRYKDLSIKCKPKPNLINRNIITNINSVWNNLSLCSEKENSKDCDAFLRKPINYFCSGPKNYADDGPIMNRHGSKKCYTPPNYISILTGENDPRSPENLLNLHMKETCKQFLAAEKIHSAIFERHYVDKKFNISGLYCKNNRSLVLLAMDSLLHYQFAERLGVDLSKKTDKSAVIIVNEKMESHYIMQDPINTWRLKKFIYNFTENLLNRSLKSIASLRNPIYKETIKDKFKIVVKELYADSFLPIVLQKNKAVIVLYYSKHCSFCSGISHYFLLTAKNLLHVENLLFARIDGDTNSLPWEYTMESYPTILFFPANRKSESRVYPSTVPVTVPNLISFILLNIDPSLKLHVMWSVCNHTKFPEDKSSCNSSLLGETLSVIDRTLREWRKSNKRQKQVLLYSLRQLRQLHLLFAHASHKHELIQAYFKKLNSKIGYSQDYSNQTKIKNVRRKDEL